MYDFKDNKTSGTVTITKKWDDGLTNDERDIPDMSISTKKPSKSAKGYTITFHGNGLKFADGTDENMVVYNSSGHIVEGSYKEAVGTGVAWYSDKTCKNRVMISDDGVPQVELTGDLDLWAKEMTFDIKGRNDSYSKKYNDFNYLIPDTVTEIIFTDEVKPKTKEVIDVDADGDGGVVAWLDDDAGTVMKVSTQIPGVKVQAAAEASSFMFYNRSKLQKIDFKMLDTQNVTNMSHMFSGCSGLTGIDLSPLNTANVTNMSYMFKSCSKLTELNLAPLDTKNVTNMRNMFDSCEKLNNLNTTQLNTSRVTDMSGMFYKCISFSNLDLSNFDTSAVIEMGGLSRYEGASGFASFGQDGMFEDCSSLTSLIIPFDTSHVTNFGKMFKSCKALNTLDITTFDTSAAKNMSSMFDGCESLMNIDLSKISTQNVTSLNGMFYNCKSLKSIDFSSFNTSKVTNMYYMLRFCKSLINIDVSSFDTQKVTTMHYMFDDCSGLKTLTTGTAFKFVGTDYGLPGTWQNTTDETFTSGSFPSNVTDTYTKISS